MMGIPARGRVTILATPSRLNYTYYEEALVSVRVQNQLEEPILIDSVSLSFEQEPGTEVLAIGGPVGTRSVQPGKSSKPLNVRFEVPLLFRPSTNKYQVVVKYRLLSQPGNLLEAVSGPDCYVIIESLPLTAHQVFLSHCVPEDSALAQQLGVFLRRAGFSAYMAEIDDRIGTVYWKEKLEPEIRRSIGMVVLWTPGVEARSDAVGREIRFAQDNDVPAYPLLELGPSVVASYPGFFALFPREEIEHLGFVRGNPVPALMRLVDQVEREVEEGKVPVSG